MLSRIGPIRRARRRYFLQVSPNVEVWEGCPPLPVAPEGPLFNENVMLNLTLETKFVLLHLLGPDLWAIAALGESFACCS